MLPRSALSPLSNHDRQTGNGTPGAHVVRGFLVSRPRPAPSGNLVGVPGDRSGHGRSCLTPQLSSDNHIWHQRLPRTRSKSSGSSSSLLITATWNIVRKLTCSIKLVMLVLGIPTLIQMEIRFRRELDHRVTYLIFVRLS